MLKTIQTCAILFACLGFWSSSADAQIAFDDNFENGRLDTARLDTTFYTLWPITNLHFRVTNAFNEDPTFRIFDSVGFQLRAYHHMVYRYEGDTAWNFFDTAHKAGTTDYYYFENHSAFLHDTVYVSYCFPYTYSDLQQYMNSLSGKSHVLGNGVKGLSYQGRNLYGYQITDTLYEDCYKENIVITVRQHPTEPLSGYFTEGFTDFLLDVTDTTADFLRRNYHFYIYPMLNPDGVYNGSGQNALGQGLNREWEDSLISGGVPEIDTIRPVIWQETNQRVEWSIDIHSNPGSNIPYYWWGYTMASAVPQWQIDKSTAYVQAVAAIDASSPINTSLFQNYVQGSGVNASLTAANWFRRSFGAVAYTFEPTTEPMGPSGDNAIAIDRMKMAGASLAKGFYFVYDNVEPLSGAITAGNNSLIGSAAGGHVPYSYSWAGPVTGNLDTLNNLLTGLYTLTITDSMGCTWEQQYAYTSLANIAETSVENAIKLYPNPAHDLLTLEPEKPCGQTTIQLVDMLGKVHLEASFDFDSPQHIALPSGLSGLYVVVLSLPGSVLKRTIAIFN